MLVVGVDGCPKGWIAIAYDTTREALTSQTFLGPRPFQDLLAAYPEAVCIAVDIPIGLSREIARLPDTDARRILGPRRSSVFPAPDPRIVGMATYAEASAHSRALLNKGISQPEVCFWALANGTPMEHPKREAAGFEERHALLTAAFPDTPIPMRQEAGRYAPPAKADDILDAIAAAWTARRFAEGRAGRLPDAPLLDERGLRMEIVY
jgi:predicted RNase H-like nuclease